MSSSAPTRSRKQREIQERHQLILGVARRLLLERGYLGLTMDRVAAAIEYSKGTIYQHFKNKEELVTALTVETAEARASFFERAATFRGRPRERLTAVGLAAELFVLLYPDHFRCENVVRIASIKEKVSPGLQGALKGCEMRCMGIAAGIVRDGVAQGDLCLPEGTGAQELTFALWAMSFGTFALEAQGFHLQELGIACPLRTLRHNQHLLLDGYAWRPLSTEHDYEATRERIKAEVFPAECRRLGARASW